jgi:CHAT domain-containing protein
VIDFERLQLLTELARLWQDPQSLGTEDGRLEVKELFGMNLNASLVVLSGCETGLGKLSSGDELIGLTRAFICADTPSVVASLWKVDDHSTAQLMSGFYENQKTMTKVEALRQAQLKMIRGNGRSDVPARRGVGGIAKLGDTRQRHLRHKTLSLPRTLTSGRRLFWWGMGNSTRRWPQKHRQPIFPIFLICLGFKVVFLVDLPP